MFAARHARAYGLPEVAVAGTPREPSGLLPLLILVIGLAAATIWYVALPVLPNSGEHGTVVRGVRHAIGHHEVRPLSATRIVGVSREVPSTRQGLTRPLA